MLEQEDILKFLDKCYERCLDGIPGVSPEIEKLADDYCKKVKSKEEACKVMISHQIVKCTVSGFITGFGGFITMPVTIPADVASVLYVQMRMIACTAYLAGFDINSDQTKTFVYACLAGISVNEIIKQTGIKFGIKFTTKMVEKIPGKVLTKINQKVGFRFITKFGTKGLINIGKAIPFVGAFVGGGLDWVETKIIANRTYEWFFQHDFSLEENEWEVTDANVAEEIDITEEVNQEVNG